MCKSPREGRVQGRGRAGGGRSLAGEVQGGKDWKAGAGRVEGRDDETAQVACGLDMSARTGTRRRRHECTHRDEMSARTGT